MSGVLRTRQMPNRPIHRDQDAVFEDRKAEQAGVRDLLMG